MASEYGKQIVQIYYLGGYPHRPGVPPYINLAGESYVLPAVGEALSVPRYVAEDMIKKYNVREDRPIFSYKPIPSIAVPLPPQKQFTKEELLQMLAEMDTVKQEEDEVVEKLLAEADDEPVVPPPAPKPAKPAKAEKGAKKEEPKQPETQESAADKPLVEDKN